MTAKKRAKKVPVGKRVKRRELLEHAGVALSGLALSGIACSDGDDGDSPMNSASGQGGAGQGASGSGGSGQGASGSSGDGGNDAGGAGGSAGSSDADDDGAGAGTGASGTGAGAGSGTDGAGNGGDGGSAGGDGGSAGSDPGDGRVRVSIVRRAALDDAVARAVELAGGLDEIKSGDSVFIKINAVSDRAIGTPGIRTSNEMIAAVIKRVKEQSPGTVIVGDRSARTFPDTAAVFRNAGIEAAAIAAGADELHMPNDPDSDPDAWTLLQPEGYEVAWQSAGGILCMKRMLEVDHLINVPTCKNHRFALFTLSMKLFIGAIGDDSRDPLHFAESIAANFNPIGRDIAVLNLPFSPLMNILDATTALINGGPQGDGADAVRASPGLVFASRDRVALDAAGVSLIKLELSRNDVPQPDGSNGRLRSTSPFMFPQIVEASMRGLGVGMAEDVELVFDDVPDSAAIEQIFRS